MVSFISKWFTFFSLLFFTTNIISSTDFINTQLSSEERSWLEGKVKITMAMESNWAPMNFVDENGNLNGIGHDYIKVIDRKLGNRIKLVPGKFVENYELVKSGKVDALLDITQNAERDKYFYFTRPYLNIPHVIVAKKGSEYLSSESSLYDKKLALEKGFYSVKYFRNKYPGINIVEYGNSSLALGAVARGEADAYAGNRAVISWIIEKELISNLSFHGRLEKKGSILSIGVNKEQKILADILDKALASITQDEEKEIHSRWIGFENYNSSSKQSPSETIKLSKEEINWLKNNPSISVSNELDWSPFNFYQDGLEQGFSIDYIKLLGAKLGLKINFVTGPSWAEFMGMIKEQKLDIILNIVRTEEREKFILFTKPFIKNPKVIISREENPFNSLSDLEGKTIVIPKDFFYEDVLKREYPEINITTADNVLGCLKTVKFEKADATISAEAVIGHQIKRNLISGLHFSGEVKLGSDNYVNLNLGVRKDLPILQSILDKGIESLDSEEVDKIKRKWLYNSVTYGGEQKLSNLWELIIKFSSIAIFLILVIYITFKIISRYQRGGDVNFEKIQLINIVVISIFIASIVSLIWFSLNYIRGDAKLNIKSSMLSVNRSTGQGLKLWIDENLELIKRCSNSSTFVKLVEKQIGISNKGEIANSREYLEKIRESLVDRGCVDNFYIISSDYINIVSKSDIDLGKRSIIGEYRREVLAKVFSGVNSFIPPIWIDKNGKSDPKHYFSSPIKSEDGEIIAIIAIEKSPIDYFSEICSLGNLGNRGETYGFDLDGRLLSRSGYEDILRSDGILKKDQSSILNIYMKDLSQVGTANIGVVDLKNLPDTEIFSRSKEVDEGVILTPYRNYVGKEVIGVWKWHSDLNFGVVTEVDYKEALSGYYLVRNIIATILSIILILVIGSTLALILIARRSNLNLRRLNDNLEQSVEERSKDLILANRNLNNTIEALTHPFYVIDVNTYQIILANKAAKDLSGREGVTCYSLTHNSETPCSSEEHPCPLEVIKRTKEPFVVEHIHFDKSGEQRFVEVHGYPIIDEDGNLIQMIEYSLDITERKRMADALKESQERFELAVKGSGDALWEYDSSGNSWYSPRFTEMLGYAQGEVENSESTWQSHIHPEDKDSSIIEFNNHILKEMEYDIEYRLRCKDGVYRWFRSRAKSERDDEGVAIKTSGTISDITKQKESELAVKKFSHVVEGSPVTIVITDKSGNIEYVNRKFTEITGYSYDEVMGKNPRVLNAGVQPKKFYIKLWETIRSGNTWYGEFCNRKKNWEIFWEAATISPLTNDKGEVESFVAIKEDITEKKRAEVELMKAKRKAEAATKAKSDFLANMSHEIRTPMNAILGLSNLALKTDLTDKQFDYINKIDSSAKALLGIINDILDFSKIEAGKLTMERIDFDLNDVMYNLSNMISLRAQEKELELIFNIHPNTPSKLIGDPLRLGQVLLNLANNAVKFTEVGEIVIDIDPVEFDKEVATLKFSIKDTGIGMSKEQISNLFNSFQQGDSSTTRKYGGSGLGLAISKRFITIMGGDIEVESVVGEGSCFTFTANFGVKDLDKESYITPEYLNDLKVLVVDDNDTFRGVIVENLVEFGFDVKGLSSGKAALDLIVDKRELFDLIFIDWQMPEIDGIEICRRIKQEKSLEKQPKIIMITGFGREDVMKLAEDLNLDGFLLKPITHSLLYDAIINVYGKQKNYRSARINNQQFIPDGFDQIRGAKILVVEDNEINRQVATELLENEGFFIDTAENGKIALDQIGNNSYDLVLLDLQMPVMDGFTATEEIRKDKRFDKLPLVALTADAVSGVNERALEVGMDDFITKPINPDSLFKTLVKWIMPGERTLPENYQNREELISDESAIPPLPGFNLEAGILRFGGNLKRYKELINMFTINQIDFKSKVVDALDNNRVDDALREAHTLKGVAGNISAVELAKKAENIETYIVDNNFIRAKELVGIVDSEIKVIEQILKPYLEENENEYLLDREVSFDDIKEDLEKLKSALAVWDTEAQFHLKKINEKIKGSKFEDMFSAVNRYVASYENEKALEELDRF